MPGSVYLLSIHSGRTHHPPFTDNDAYNQYVIFEHLRNMTCTSLASGRHKHRGAGIGDSQVVPQLVLPGTHGPNRAGHHLRERDTTPMHGLWHARHALPKC